MNVKHAVVRVLGMGLILSGLARAEATTYKIAVLQISDSPVPKWIVASVEPGTEFDLKGHNPECTEIVRKFFAAQGRFEVASQEAVDKVVKATGLGADQAYSAADASKAGKALGVEHVVLVEKSIPSLGKAGHPWGDGGLGATLRVLKSSDGSEVSKTVRAGAISFSMAEKELKFDSKEAELAWRLSKTLESWAKVVAAHRKLLLDPLPITGEITGVQDPKKRIVTVDVGSAHGAVKGDELAILDESGKPAGVLEIKKLGEKTSEAEYSKKAETAAKPGAKIRSGKL